MSATGVSGADERVPTTDERGVVPAHRKAKSSLGPESYEAAFPELHGVAYRAAFRVAQNRERAEDCAQEAMVRVFQRWGRIEDPVARRAWVARVAANLAIDMFRRQATVRKFAHRFMARDASNVESPGVNAGLAEVLSVLPKRQREVIMLRVLADQSEADTAAVLGCSVRSVRRELSAGLEALRVRQVADLVRSASEEACDPARPGSAVAAAHTAVERQARKRKARGVVAGIVAFVVAALGSGMFGTGVVQLRPDDANDRRNQTSTTTTTVAPPATTVVVDPDGTVRVVPVAGPTANGGNVGTPSVPGTPAAPGVPAAPGGPQADAPAPVPSSDGGFPSAATTGVPAGTVLSRYAGPSTITAPNTVIDGKDISGCLVINAPNVMIRNSRIVGTCDYIVLTDDAATNALFERVEVSGKGGPSGNACILGSNLTLRSVYLHDCLNAVVPYASVRLETSFVTARDKAVYCSKCSDLAIVGSNLEVLRSGTAAVQVEPRRPIGAVAITGSRLNGGGYALYGGFDPARLGNAPTSLSVTNNVFGANSGYSYAAWIGAAAVWSGNTPEGSGAQLPRP